MCYKYWVFYKCILVSVLFDDFWHVYSYKNQCILCELSFLPNAATRLTYGLALARLLNYLACVMGAAGQASESDEHREYPGVVREALHPQRGFLCQRAAPPSPGICHDGHRASTYTTREEVSLSAVLSYPAGSEADKEIYLLKRLHFTPRVFKPEKIVPNHRSCHFTRTCGIHCVHVGFSARNHI